MMMTMKGVLGGGGVESEVAKSAIWEVGNPNLVVIDTTINSSATCLARWWGLTFFFLCLSRRIMRRTREEGVAFKITTYFVSRKV